MKKWLKRAIIPTLVLVLGGVGAHFIIKQTDDSLVIAEQVAIRQAEHSHLLHISQMYDKNNENLLAMMYCRLHHHKLLLHPETQATLSNIVSKDLRCSQSGYNTRVDASQLLRKYEKTINEEDFENIRECIAESKVVADSCVAKDKSGLHSKPRAFCELSISAGKDRFFVQDAVTVTSESYRRNAGNRAKKALKPKRDLKSDVTTAFAGKIGCTHKRGTGRTCESRAAIQAISYPIKCKGITEYLKLIAQR